MDENIISEATETATETSSFGAEIAKSFVISAATTAGFMAGLLTVGYVKKKLDERKKAKQTAESQTETPTAN